uniref:Uncharacterized protein n=1 Tax=Anopheles coluzzii TaxID=1518534 RepID=A0A8W7PL92_ANOCL
MQPLAESKKSPKEIIASPPSRAPSAAVRRRRRRSAHPSFALGLLVRRPIEATQQQQQQRNSNNTECAPSASCLLAVAQKSGPPAVPRGLLQRKRSKETCGHQTEMLHQRRNTLT